jgi:hypothetical protein
MNKKIVTDSHIQKKKELYYQHFSNLEPIDPIAHELNFWSLRTISYGMEPEGAQ